MKLFSREKHEKVIIAGCGRFGSKLVSILADKNDNISIIDINEQSFSRLPTSLKYNWIEGDATDTDILEYAGIKTADVLVAVTNDDDTNIMIAKIAKEYYQVNQVIARIEDTSKEASYKQMGIITICPIVLSLNEFQNVLINQRERSS